MLNGVRPYAPSFQAARPASAAHANAFAKPRFGTGEHERDAENKDSRHVVHFQVTNKQHRFIQGMASTFFLIGSALWGDSSWHQFHEVFNEDMLAPVFTGMGSLVLLINSIIPVENWRSRRPVNRAARRQAQHRAQGPESKRTKS